MRILAVILVLFMSTNARAADKRPMTVDDLLAVKGVSDPQVSPDGTLVAYVVTEVDRDANKSRTSIWVVPASGGASKQLTSSPGTNNHPRWSPDGKSLLFVSDRGGSAQAWLLPVDGGEARQVTKLPIDVSGPIWSPKGDKIAFVAEVYPQMSPQATADEDKRKAELKTKVKSYDSLMIRHWNVWDEGKRSHLFVCDVATGEARDVIPGWKANVPPAPFGGSNDYAFDGSGSGLVFTSEPLTNHAVSTNTDIWYVTADGSSHRNLTEANKGADAQPAFSADGRLLAWASQERAGFEADQWVLNYAPFETDGVPAPVPVSKGSDRSVMSYSWDPSGPNLIGILDDGGFESVVDFPTMARRAPRPLLQSGTYPAAYRTKNGSLIVLKNAANAPAEVYRAETGRDGSNVVALTHHNDALVEKLDLPGAERFTFSGAQGDEVQGWLVRPPGFDAKKKYPVLFLIHGGPQGAWHDEWHNRWNYALFAAPGYCVVAINPRGSTGFGQKFTDDISKDWNGKVYEDLMAGLDHALKSFPYLDSSRMAAAGGSYGGYMVNWIAGHSDRFKCLISHAGIFDLTSMNVTTEELWFSTWEFGGMPWETPDLHAAQSPSTFVKNFKTPTLVIHGALDFRVPDTQGLAMFTALQKQGVPSRYVFFPDEGHWILKPGNRVAWWNEVHTWLAKYLDGR